MVLGSAAVDKRMLDLRWRQEKVLRAKLVTLAPTLPRRNPVNLKVELEDLVAVKTDRVVHRQPLLSGVHELGHVRIGVRRVETGQNAAWAKEAHLCVVGRG